MSQQFSLGKSFAGLAGRADEVIFEGEPDQPDWQATLGLWFLTCPGQSPGWENYVLSVIHLRPIDGVPPAHIRVAGATHEVMVVAIDPEYSPVPTDPSSWHFLWPLNVEEQVHLPNDQAAKQLIEDSARAVTIGVLPAEPGLAGAVEPWRTTLIKTAAHLRGETHAP